MKRKEKINYLKAKKEIPLEKRKNYLKDKRMSQKRTLSMLYVSKIFQYCHVLRRIWKIISIST